MFKYAVIANCMLFVIYGINNLTNEAVAKETSKRNKSSFVTSIFAMETHSSLIIYYALFRIMKSHLLCIY